MIFNKYCFLNHPVDYVVTEYTCEYHTGDGIGGTEMRIGPALSPQECTFICIKHKKNHPSINGATYGRGLCYCELNMNGRNSNADWKSCMLQSKSENIN